MKTLNAIIPFFALVSAIPAFAGIPDAVTYAGTLNQGAAPANGTFTVVFGLFDAAANGNRVFEQTEASLPVSQGQLVVDLGDDPLNPLSDEVLKGGALFLDIVVNGEALSPRVPFTAVPFARVAKQAEHASKADDADTVGGLSADDIIDAFTATGGVQRIGNAFSLAPLGITQNELADAAVTSGKIANNSVTSAKILDGGIATADLANGAITSAKLAASSVVNSAIAPRAVDTTELALDAVTTTRIHDAAVNASKVKGIDVFLGANGCGRQLMLKDGSFDLFCRTDSCISSGGNNAFFTCAGNCTRNQPDTCSVTTKVGTLVIE